MAGVDRRNNKKRLECLKKKSEELSVLCDVEVKFLCREDGDTSSFHSWPEDPSKYRKSSNSADLHSLLGKRKERGDADQANFGKKVRESEGFQMGFPNNVTESSNSCEREIESESECSRSEMMGCLRYFFEEFESVVVDVVGYEDLERVTCLMDEAKKCTDEQIQFLKAGGRGGEEEGVPNDSGFEDSGVDWEGLMNNIQTADFDFNFGADFDLDFNFDFDF